MAEECLKARWSLCYYHEIACKTFPGPSCLKNIMALLTFHFGNSCALTSWRYVRQFAVLHTCAAPVDGIRNQHILEWFFQACCILDTFFRISSKSYFS